MLPDRVVANTMAYNPPGVANRVPLLANGVANTSASSIARVANTKA